MAFCSLMAGVPSPLPPPVPGPGQVSHRTCTVDIKLALKSFQARIKSEQPKPVDHVSRRDAVCLVSAALLSNLMASGAAEARRIKPETRQKIREKLDRLREKGGVTKEKTDSISGSKGREPPESSLIDLSVPLVEAAV